jgi:hypothetical protein
MHELGLRGQRRRRKERLRTLKELDATAPSGDLERLTRPDGAVIQTANFPSGDLEAARRASGAPFVVSASSAATMPPLVRALAPAVVALMRFSAVRELAKRWIAGVRLTAQAQTGEFS